MLIFGHTGLTLGAVISADFLYHVSQHLSRRGAPAPDPNDPAGPRTPRDYRFPSWSSVSKNIDLRLLLIGAMLPDIIDKPVGIYILGNVFSNGRIFSHSLIFLLALCIVGIVLYLKTGSKKMTALIFGTFTHLLCDGMWRTPQTFYWPFLGLSFPKVDATGWISWVMERLVREPGLYIPEILGFLLVICFTAVLVRRRALTDLIRKGVLIYH